MSNLHNIPGRTKKLPPLRVGVGGPVGSGDSLGGSGDGGYL